MSQCPYFKGGGYSGTDPYCDVDRKPIPRTTIDNTCFSYSYDKCVNYKKKASDGGCYLTTACMEVMQEVFDDNCTELTLLRRLRDDFVETHHPEIVERYYLVAPRIVAAIDSKDNRRGIYEAMYHGMVLPVVARIEAEDYSGAFAIYKEETDALERKYVNTGTTLKDGD